MLMCEFNDSVKEGDGDRVYHVLMLIFRLFGRNNYALEALNLQLQCHGLAPNVSEIKWSRFVNSKGGLGRNVSCDLHIEHLNRSLKQAISALGSNNTQKSVSKCLHTVIEVWDNFYEQTSITKPTGKHSHAAMEKDMELMVNQLHKESQVFREVNGRKHSCFPNVRQNLFATMDWDSMEEWFKKHKALFMEINTEEDPYFK